MIMSKAQLFRHSRLRGNDGQVLNKTLKLSPQVGVSCLAYLILCKNAIKQQAY